MSLSMRTLNLLAGVAVTLIISNAHASEGTARKLRDSALEDRTAYSIVSDLTTLFGPRPAGSEAEKNAAEWCAKTMRSIGLRNVHLESFPLTEWRRGVERGEIVGRGAQQLAITALGGT